MGANTYRLMSGFATVSKAPASHEPMTDEGTAIAELAKASKVVFSSTLQPPLSWPDTRLISGDAVEAVAAMKRDGTSPMRTLGSLILCRSLLQAGLVDRFRVRLPRDHREHRPRPHLRRVSRCRPRDGCQPDVRRQPPAARVRPHGAHRSTRLAPRLLGAARLCDVESLRKAGRTVAALLNLDNAEGERRRGRAVLQRRGWAGRSAATGETSTSRCRSQPLVVEHEVAHRLRELLRCHRHSSRSAPSRLPTGAATRAALIA